MGLLRLLTTAAVMNDSSLSMKKAWKAYDGFLEDERVEFLAEPLRLKKHSERSPQARTPLPNSGPTLISSLSPRSAEVRW